MTTIYLFHRDLRVVDSNALFEASQLKAPVLPLFIFTPMQVSEKNKLRSFPSIQFMIQSLQDLESAIHDNNGKLYFAYGDTIDILKQIHKKQTIGAVVETADYTPFAKQRTHKLAEFCKSIDAKYMCVEDSYLTVPGSILTNSGTTYQKFTPFYEKAHVRTIPAPRAKIPTIQWQFMKGRNKGRSTRKLQMRENFGPLAYFRKRLIPTENKELAVKGGRTEALQLLHTLPKDYADTRNIPSIPTSLLSAHNHYGTVSIREVYHRAKHQPEFTRQLFWRDFYGHIMADFETLYGVSAYEFQKETPHQSQKAKKAFREWCVGRTGVPLVDAGMRQLLRTGWMHNRVRMVVSSWLVKDMGVHWRLGERFFAKHLVDYDPAQNMMNWIFMASVLPFSSAPFRRIDAYVTAKRFDPDGTYVRTWMV